MERDFARLGFEASTRQFLPGALPLARTGRTPIVLHGGTTASADSGARGERLVLAVDELEPALGMLQALGVRAPKAPFSSGSLGRSVTLRTETGLALRVLERSNPQLAFERLRALAGEWEGTSDHGWSSRIRIEVIAGGSAVLETTAFEAHPGETMLTLFHKDGPRLLLTHYCVAGNQPRFQLLGVSANQQLVAYDILQLNNMPNADLPVPLADNVVDMRVRFGVDAAGVSDGIISTWVNPAAAPFNANGLNTVNPAQASNIVAVSISMLVRGDRIEREGDPLVSPGTFTMFSALPPAMQMVIKLPAAEQRRNYRLIELTIPLRNAIVTAPARTPPP